MRPQQETAPPDVDDGADDLPPVVGPRNHLFSLIDWVDQVVDAVPAVKVDFTDPEARARFRAWLVLAMTPLVQAVADDLAKGAARGIAQAAALELDPDYYGVAAKRRARAKVAESLSAQRMEDREEAQRAVRAQVQAEQVARAAESIEAGSLALFPGVRLAVPGVDNPYERGIIGDPPDPTGGPGSTGVSS